MPNFIIAMTINKKHTYYKDDINKVADYLRIESKEYLEIVKHKATELHNEHYHVLLFSNKSPNWWKEQKVGHIENVRNTKAYIKYMNNHDKIDSKIIGTLPYVENNNDGLIDFLIKYGPVKTVQTYGFQVLKSYGALQKFYEDYQAYTQSDGLIQGVGKWEKYRGKWEKCK